MQYITSGYVGKIYKNNNNNIVKVIPIQKDKIRIKRLIKEIETLKLLQDEPWSTDIYEIKKYKNNIRIKMENLDQTVCQWSRKEHGFEEWMNMYRQLFNILYILHKKYKLYHTDVHCGNLMWKNKRLYLIDFGVVTNKSNPIYDYRQMTRLISGKYLINELHLFYYIKENSNMSDKQIWNILRDWIKMKRYIKQHDIPVSKFKNTIQPHVDIHLFLKEINKGYTNRRVKNNELSIEDILKKFFPIQYSLTRLSFLKPNIISRNPVVIEEKWINLHKDNDIVDNFSFSCRMKCKVGEKSPEEYKDENPDVSWREAQKVAGVCTNFNISRVIYLIKYLFGDNYRKISWLDPSAGWGSRLLGAISLQIKKYRGVDPNSCLEPIYKKIIDEYGNGGDYSIYKGGFESYKIDDKYDLVFTSPPFFDFEVYSENNEQSIKLHTSERGWIDEFLLPLIKRGKECLKKDGYLVLYIEPKGEISYDEIFEGFDCLYMKYKDEEKKRVFYLWKKE